MFLSKARVQNYRSIIDSGEFEVEALKTILVGPNEAGKTVLLRALQQLNAPESVAGFDPLRDYPRSKYNDISSGRVKVEDVTVVDGYFTLDENDKELLPEEYRNCGYHVYKKLDNQVFHALIGAPDQLTYGAIRTDIMRMLAHMDKQYSKDELAVELSKPSILFRAAFDDLLDETTLKDGRADQLNAWLVKNLLNVEEDNDKEETRYNNLLEQTKLYKQEDRALTILNERLPVFVLFNNYFKVKPSIHLAHLAQRQSQNILDDEYFDYGNLCLLKLLGFEAQNLSDLGNTVNPDMSDRNAVQAYKDQLDRRNYQLNAASVRLTNEIRTVWKPNANRPEADRLRVTADGQYLKVVVEDDLGVEIELDQRSEGFQWLVSFFVVFFAEAMDKHANAILLLDEPGMSLHGLKQRDFRETISKLAVNNQTIYTTHSPFLVGPSELDIVKVVEMKDRTSGTKVHTTISSSDPAGLLPLQEALGYDLAQSLFSQQKNLILEGITDYWYLDATSAMLGEGNVYDLDEKIALVFANSAGKVVYYATILHAHNLNVAALLDSDAAGDQAAQQESLVHTLGNKNILRTKDYCTGVAKAEIEDLLRATLIKVVLEEYGVDVDTIAGAEPNRSIVDIFAQHVPSFSKYKLAKAYMRWTRGHSSTDLTINELGNWTKLLTNVTKALNRLL